MWVHKVVLAAQSQDLRKMMMGDVFSVQDPLVLPMMGTEPYIWDALQVILDWIYEVCVCQQSSPVLVVLLR